VPPRRPLAVAITGGIGAGKSEALRSFGRHGVPTISSDDIVHRLLREDESVRGAMLERFGGGVLDAEGQLDRRAIGRRVFPDPKALEWLESLLHPLVVREYLDWRDGLAEQPNPPLLCVTEVPLLYEVGGEQRFDVVVVITAPEAVRRGRARTAIDDRASRLIPDDDKAKRADFVYVNDGTIEQLDAFVSGVIGKLTER
jgi:dephospho-CoA kinase